MPSTQSTDTRRKLIDYTQRGKSLPQHKEAMQSKSSIDNELKLESFGGVPSILHLSFSSIDTEDFFDMLESEDEETENPEPVEFYLKIPSRDTRNSGATDLRERFQRQTRSNGAKKCNHIQTILSEPASRTRSRSQRTLS